MRLFLLLLIVAPMGYAQSPSSALADDLRDVTIASPSAAADPLYVPTVDRDLAVQMRRASLWLDSLAHYVSNRPAPETAVGQEEHRKWLMQFDRAAFAYSSIALRMQRDILSGRDVTMEGYAADLRRAESYGASLSTDERALGLLLRLGTAALREFGVIPRLQQLWARASGAEAQEATVARAMQERAALAATLDTYLIFGSYQETVARLTNR